MAVSPEERLTLDVENKLKEDVDGEFKTRLRADLTDQVHAIDTLLKAGVSPEEFSQLDTIKKGLQSAEVILEGVWSYYHPSS